MIIVNPSYSHYNIYNDDDVQKILEGEMVSRCQCCSDYNGFRVCLCNKNKKCQVTNIRNCCRRSIEYKNGYTTEDEITEMASDLVKYCERKALDDRATIGTDSNVSTIIIDNNIFKISDTVYMGFTDSNFRLSVKGMAIKDKKGRFLTFDEGSLVDVTKMTINISIMEIPCQIKDLNKGDIIIHNDKPFFVLDNENNVIDIEACTVTRIVPVKNIFGIELTTKIVGIFNTNDTELISMIQDEDLDRNDPMRMMSIINKMDR